MTSSHSWAPNCCCLQGRALEGRESHDPLHMVEGLGDHAVSNSVTASSGKGADDNGSSKDTASFAAVGFAVALAWSSSNSASTSAIRGLD